ncbi:MAG: bis(5'-nucleosyl)-tetraphosphatase (symmetrical) YqeK [Raoultibacter sp.]
MTVKEPFGEENYEHMRQLLSARVGKSRFKHSLGVAMTAARLAEVYGYDVDKARMAGLVHDWDKALSPEESRACVEEFSLVVDPLVVETMPWLLHGPTAAATLARDFPELGEDIYQAAARHTSAALDMTALDMIVYVSDLIEPNRRFEDVDDVRAAVGKVALEDLFFRALKCIALFLIGHDRLLHPVTLEVWNHYVLQRPTMQQGRLAAEHRMR